MGRGLPQIAIPPWERQKGLSHGTESESDNLFDDRQRGKVFRHLSRQLLNQTRKMGGLPPDLLRALVSFIRVTDRSEPQPYNVFGRVVSDLCSLTQFGRGRSRFVLAETATLWGLDSHAN